MCNNCNEIQDSAEVQTGAEQAQWLMPAFECTSPSRFPRPKSVSQLPSIQAVTVAVLGRLSHLDNGRLCWTITLAVSHVHNIARHGSRGELPACSFATRWITYQAVSVQNVLTIVTSGSAHRLRLLQVAVLGWWLAIRSVLLEFSTLAVTGQTVQTRQSSSIFGYWSD